MGRLRVCLFGTVRRAEQPRHEGLAVTSIDELRTRSDDPCGIRAGSGCDFTQELHEIGRGESLTTHEPEADALHTH